MKIIEVINSLSYRGGAQVFAYSLTKELIKQGHEVILLSINQGIDSSFQGDFVQSINRKGKLDFLSILRFKKMVKKYQPDIIHMHLSCLLTYHFAFGYRKRKWQLFETMHSVPGSTTTKISRYLRKQYLNKNDLTLIAISPSLAKLASSLYQKEIPYINNGVELNPKQSPNMVTKYDLIIVANMNENKNHILLFHALKHLKEKGKIFSLICLGQGPLFKKNKSMVQELGLQDCIYFAGQVEDCSTYYQQSKAFVLTSLREGNPISILEAMSYGLPIIAPKIGGIIDVIQEGENGYLYQVNDEEGLQNCITCLFENKNQFQKISKNNIIRANHYSMSNCTQQYIHLFQQVKGSKK